MAYFKIDTEQRAEEISRKMYSIMNPGNSGTTHLFEWGIDSNGQAYMNIPLDMICPVYVSENFETVLRSVADLLMIEQTERTELRQYLEGGSVVLSNLIPSTLEEFTPYFEWNP